MEQFFGYNKCLLSGSTREARRRRLLSLAWLLILLALCILLRLPALAAKKTAHEDETKAQALAALTKKIDASASVASECRIFACTPWRVVVCLPSRPPEGEDGRSLASCRSQYAYLRKPLIISKLYPRYIYPGVFQRGYRSRV